MKWSRIGQVVIVLVAILLFVANIPQSAAAMGESTRDHYHVRVVQVVDDLNAFLTEQGFTPADYLIQPDWSAENPADWHAVIVRVVTDQAFQWEPNVYTWQDAAGRQFRQPQGHLTSRNYTVPMGAIDPEGDWVTWESPSYGGGYQREPISYFMARLRSQAVARRPAAQPTTPTRLDGQAQSVLRVLEAYRTATSASDRLTARETFADALRRFLGRHPTANRYEVRARGPAYLDFVGIDPTGAACYGKATWLGLQMGGPLIAWEDFLAEVCAGSGVTASDPDLSVAVITSTVADMAKVYEMIREAADHGLIYVDITRYNISTGDYRLLFGTHPSQPGVVHLYDHHLLWVGSTTSRGASGDNVVLTRYERDVLAAWLQDASGTLVLGGQDQGGKEPFLPNEAYTGLHPVDWFESGTTAWTLTPVVVSTFEEGLNGWNQTEAIPYCEYITGASRAYRTGHSPPIENETIPGPDIHVFRSFARDALADPLRIDVEVRRASHPDEHNYGVYVGLWWNGAWHGGTPTYSGPPAFSSGYHTVTFLSVSGWKQGAPSTVEVRVRCINYDGQPVELDLDNIAVYTIPSADSLQFTTPPAYVGSGLQVGMNATSGPAPGERWGYAFSMQRSLSPATLYLGFYTQLSFWYRSTRNFRVRVTVDWQANPDAMTAQFDMAATGGAWQRFTQELYNLTYVHNGDPPLLRTYPDYLLAVTFSYPEIDYVGGKNLWATGADLLILDELDCVARGGASLIPFLDTYIRNQPGADYNLGFGEDFHTYRWDPTTQRGHQNYTYWDATFDNGTGYFHVWAGAPTPPGAAPGPFTPGSLPRSIWWEANRGATWIQYVNTTCPTQKRWTFGLDMTNVGTTAQPQWVQAAEYAPRLLIEWRNHSTTLYTDSVAFLGALAAEPGQVWGIGVQTTKATAGFALDPTTPVAVGQFLYGPRLPDRALPTLGTAMFHVVPRLNAYLGGTWYATSLCQLNQQVWQRGSDPRRTVTAVVNSAAGYVELGYSTAMATFESMWWSFTVAVRIYATDPQPHLKLALTCHNSALDNLAVSYDLVATDWRVGYALTQVGVQLTDTGREYAFAASQVQDVSTQYATFRPRLRLASENQESFRLDFTDMATAGFRRPSLRVLDVALPGGGTRRGVQVGMTDYGPLSPNSTVVIDPQFVGGSVKDDVWAWRDTYDVYGGTDAGDLVLGVDEYGGGPEFVEVIRYPLADAYVDSAQSGVNFGSSTHLWASVPSTKYSYFKFDLTGIPTTVVIAQLKVRIQALQTTHGTIKCYQVADTSWTEGGIKWSNKPALGSQLATDTSGSVGSWDNFGVTSWAESCRGAGVMSLALTAAGPSTMGADYNSRESSGTSYDPYLYIAYYPLTKRADRVLSRFNITSIPDDPIQQIDSAVLRYSVPANGGSHTHGVEVRRATTWNWDSATASARWAWSALDPALTGAVAAGGLTCDVTSHVQAAYDAGAAFVAWRLSLVGDVNRNYLDWYRLTSSYPVGSCYLNVTYSVKPFAPTVTNLQILGRETDGGYGSDPAADNCYARREYVVQVTAGDRNGWIDMEWVNVTIAETTLTYHYYWEPGYPPGRGTWIQELNSVGQITTLNATHLLLSWNWTVPWGSSQDATPISSGVRDYTSRTGAGTVPGYADLIREVTVQDYTVDDGHVNPHQRLTFAGTLRFLAAGAVLNRPYQGSMAIRYNGLWTVAGGNADGTGHFVVSGYAPFPVAAYTMQAQPDPMGESGGGPWVGNLPVIVDKLLLEQAVVTDPDWWLNSGSVFSWTFHCLYQWTGEHLVGWTLNWNGTSYTDTDLDGAIVVTLQGHDEVLAMSGQAVEEGLGGANITGSANTLSYTVTYTRVLCEVQLLAWFAPLGQPIGIEVLSALWAHNRSTYQGNLTVFANGSPLPARCYPASYALLWSYSSPNLANVTFTVGVLGPAWNGGGITLVFVHNLTQTWCMWDVDSDADGLLNVVETFLYGTNPNAWDTDQDRMPDGWELGLGLDPLVDDGGLDLDLDGLVNLVEYLWGLAPEESDSDGDGLSDLWEVVYGYSGVTDGFEGDADGWLEAAAVVFRPDIVHNGTYAAQFTASTTRCWVAPGLAGAGSLAVFGVWLYSVTGGNYTVRVQVNGTTWFTSGNYLVPTHAWRLVEASIWDVANGSGVVTCVALVGGTTGDLIDDAYLVFNTVDSHLDPDGDGKPNIVEAALDTDPFSPLAPGSIVASFRTDVFAAFTTEAGWMLAFEATVSANARFRFVCTSGAQVVWQSEWLDRRLAQQGRLLLPAFTCTQLAFELESLDGCDALACFSFLQVFAVEDMPRTLRWEAMTPEVAGSNPRLLLTSFRGGSFFNDPKAVATTIDVAAAVPAWWARQLGGVDAFASLLMFDPVLNAQFGSPTTSVAHFLVSDAFPTSPYSGSLSDVGSQTTLLLEGFEGASPSNPQATALVLNETWDAESFHDWHIVEHDWNRALASAPGTSPALWAKMGQRGLQDYRYEVAILSDEADVYLYFRANWAADHTPRGYCLRVHHFGGTHSLQLYKADGPVKTAWPMLAHTEWSAAGGTAPRYVRIDCVDSNVTVSHRDWTTGSHVLSAVDTMYPFGGVGVAVDAAGVSSATSQELDDLRVTLHVPPASISEGKILRPSETSLSTRFEEGSLLYQLLSNGIEAAVYVGDNEEPSAGTGIYSSVGGFFESGTPVLNTSMPVGSYLWFAQNDSNPADVDCYCYLVENDTSVTHSGTLVFDRLLRIVGVVPIGLSPSAVSWVPGSQSVHFQTAGIDGLCGLNISLAFGGGLVAHRWTAQQWTTEPHWVCPDGYGVGYLISQIYSPQSVEIAGVRIGNLTVTGALPTETAVSVWLNGIQLYNTSGLFFNASSATVTESPLHLRPGLNELMVKIQLDASLWDILSLATMGQSSVVTCTLHQLELIGETGAACGTIQTAAMPALDLYVMTEQSFGQGVVATYGFLDSKNSDPNEGLYRLDTQGSGTRGTDEIGAGHLFVQNLWERAALLSDQAFLSARAHAASLNDSAYAFMGKRAGYEAFYGYASGIGSPDIKYQVNRMLQSARDGNLAACADTLSSVFHAWAGLNPAPIVPGFEYGLFALTTTEPQNPASYEWWVCKPYVALHAGYVEVGFYYHHKWHQYAQFGLQTYDWCQYYRIYSDTLVLRVNDPCRPDWESELSGWEKLPPDWTTTHGANPFYDPTDTTCNLVVALNETCRQWENWTRRLESWQVPFDGFGVDDMFGSVLGWLRSLTVDPIVDRLVQSAVASMMAAIAYNYITGRTIFNPVVLRELEAARALQLSTNPELGSTAEFFGAGMTPPDHMFWGVFGRLIDINSKDKRERTTQYETLWRARDLVQSFAQHGASVALDTELCVTFVIYDPLSGEIRSIPSENLGNQLTGLVSEGDTPVPNLGIELHGRILIYPTGLGAQAGTGTYCYVTMAIVNPNEPRLPDRQANGEGYDAFYPEDFRNQMRLDLARHQSFARPYASNGRYMPEQVQKIDENRDAWQALFPDTILITHRGDGSGVPFMWVDCRTGQAVAIAGEFTQRLDRDARANYVIRGQRGSQPEYGPMKPRTDDALPACAANTQKVIEQIQIVRLLMDQQPNGQRLPARQGSTEDQAVPNLRDSFSLEDCDLRLTQNYLNHGELRGPIVHEGDIYPDESLSADDVQRRGMAASYLTAVPQSARALQCAHDLLTCKITKDWSRSADCVGHWGPETEQLNKLFPSVYMVWRALCTTSSHPQTQASQFVRSQLGFEDGWPTSDKASDQPIPPPITEATFEDLAMMATRCKQLYGATLSDVNTPQLMSRLRQVLGLPNAAPSPPGETSLLQGIKNTMTSISSSAGVTAPQLVTLGHVSQLEWLITQVTGIDHTTLQEVASAFGSDPEDLLQRRALDGHDKPLYETLDGVHTLQLGSQLVRVIHEHDVYYELTRNVQTFRPAPFSCRGKPHLAPNNVWYSSDEYAASLQVLYNAFRQPGGGGSEGTELVSGDVDRRWCAESCAAIRQDMKWLARGVCVQDIMNAWDTSARDGGFEMYAFIEHLKSLPSLLNTLYHEWYDGSTPARPLLSPEVNLAEGMMSCGLGQESFGRMLVQINERLAKAGSAFKPLPNLKPHMGVQSPMVADGFWRVITGLLHPTSSEVIHTFGYEYYEIMKKHLEFRRPDPNSPATTLTIVDMIGPPRYRWKTHPGSGAPIEKTAENRFGWFGQTRRGGLEVLPAMKRTFAWRAPIADQRLPYQQGATVEELESNTINMAASLLVDVVTICERHLVGQSRQCAKAPPGSIAERVGRYQLTGMRRARMLMEGTTFNAADWTAFVLSTCDGISGLEARAITGAKQGATWLPVTITYQEIAAAIQLATYKNLFIQREMSKGATREEAHQIYNDIVFGLASYDPIVRLRAMQMARVDTWLGGRLIPSAERGRAELSIFGENWNPMLPPTMRDLARVPAEMTLETAWQVFGPAKMNMITFCLFWAPIGVAVGRIGAEAIGAAPNSQLGPDYAQEWGTARAWDELLDPSQKWFTAIFWGLVAFVTDYIDSVKRGVLRGASFEMTSEIVNCIFGGFQMGLAGFMGYPSDDCAAGAPGTAAGSWLTHDFDAYFLNVDDASEQYRRWLAAPAAQGGGNCAWLADGTIVAGAWRVFWDGVMLGIATLLFYADMRLSGGKGFGWMMALRGAIVSMIANVAAQSVIELVVNLWGGGIGRGNYPTYRLAEAELDPLEGFEPADTSLIGEWSRWNYWHVC